MQLGGHLGASLLTYAPVGGGLLAAGRDRLAVAGVVIAAASATLPDVDLRFSSVDHRGPTHTLWFALAYGVVLGTAGALAGTVTDRTDARLPAVVGVTGFLSTATHVAVDSLTPMGIRPFAPVRQRFYGFDVVPSRNQRGNRVLLALGLAASAAAVVCGRTLADRSGRASVESRTDGSAATGTDGSGRTGRPARR